MKKILAAILLAVSGLALCGAAWADFVFTTENGTMGLIAIGSAVSVDVSTLATGLGDDILVTAWNKGTAKTALIQRGAGSTGDKALIYTSEKWGEPKEETLLGAYDISHTAISGNGKGFFVVSEGNDYIVEFDTASDYDPTGRRYTYEPAGRTAYAKDVVIHNNVIYGLFSVTRGGSYIRSKLIALDGLLEAKTLYKSFDVGMNAVGLANTTQGQIAVAYLGASGESGGLDLLRSSSIVSIVSGDAYGGVNSVCGDSDNGVYFTGQKGGTHTLYHWSPSSSVKALSFSGTGTPKLAWDGTNKMLALMSEDRIRIINKDGALVKELDSAALGGWPTSLSFMPKSGSGDKSSDNGCDALGGGGAALALPPLLFLGYNRRRKGNR